MVELTALVYEGLGYLIVVLFALLLVFVVALVLWEMAFRATRMLRRGLRRWLDVPDSIPVVSTASTQHVTQEIPLLNGHLAATAKEFGVPFREVPQTNPAGGQIMGRDVKWDNAKKVWVANENPTPEFGAQGIPAWIPDGIPGLQWDGTKYVPGNAVPEEPLDFSKLTWTELMEGFRPWLEEAPVIHLLELRTKISEQLRALYVDFATNEDAPPEMKLLLQDYATTEEGKKEIQNVFWEMVRPPHEASQEQLQKNQAYLEEVRDKLLENVDRVLTVEELQENNRQRAEEQKRRELAAGLILAEGFPWREIRTGPCSPKDSEEQTHIYIHEDCGGSKSHIMPEWDALVKKNLEEIHKADRVPFTETKEGKYERD